MSEINLRDYYPYYREDLFIELPDEIVGSMKPYLTEEQSHWRRMRKHKVYSIECVDLDGHVLFPPPTPDELYEHKVTCHELCDALRRLPRKQMERLVAHFIFGIRISDIARVEGLHHSSVEESIERGLRNLAKILINVF